MGKIKVTITCVKHCDYQQTVYMNEEEYEIIKDLMGDDVSENDPETKEQFMVLSNHIDVSDVYYSESEFKDVTVEKK